MRRLPLALLALLLLPLPLVADPPDKATAAELARLKGSWRAVRVHVGKKVVDLTAVEGSLRFEGDCWSLVVPKAEGGDGKAEGKAVGPARRTHRSSASAAARTVSCRRAQALPDCGFPT
jgi:hypothetical protein